MQLELWSRSTRESEWLSIIGHPAVLQKIANGEADCVVNTPSKDYVVTELFAMYRKKEGITSIEVTFSEDYDVDEDPERQQKFKFGYTMVDIGNTFVRINDFSQDKAFVGLTSDNFDAGG